MDANEAQSILALLCKDIFNFVFSFSSGDIRTLFMGGGVDTY
jgi:hypothetical protein